MALTLERELSFTDWRRTQRRVAALMLGDKHVELLKYPLRRRINPQGFCYVCSRLDPNGIFDNSNSHLNKKGFFHTCEHFVKPPFVNFTQEVKFVPGDDGIDLIVDQISPLEEQTHNQADALSISVNIHRGSNSTLNPSPLVREKTFGSSVSTYDILDSSRSEVRLPSIYSHAPRASQLSSTTKIVAHSSQSGAHTGHSKRSWLSKHTAFSKQTVALSEAIDLPVGEIADSVGLPTPTADRITIIPTGVAEEENSVITGLSTFTKGTTTTDSKSSKSLFSKTTPEFKDKILDQNENENALLRLTPAARTINASGDVQLVYRVDPLARADVMPEDTEGSHVMRPKAGRKRERLSYKKQNDSSSASVSNHRPESGRLRYHHRLDYESLPKHGFEMPPTPSILKTPSEIEHPTTAVRQFTGEKGDIREWESNSSRVLQNSIVSDDVSIAFSENLNLKSRVTRSGSEKSFCRCASLAREMSVSKNVCKKCGKSCLHSSVDGNDSKTEEDTYKSINRDSLSSRRKILHPNETRVQQKSKAFTDEDYMDLESIIHEDDRHYWSSEDESFPDLDQSPSPWHRSKHAQSYPLVDPDIHKLAYLNALHEAQIRNIKQNESLEFDEIQKLRRPNVFSYFSLLPCQNASIKVPIKLGIRPDNSVKPKIGQLMQHIFGDVKLESFYPGRRVRDDKKIVFEDLSKSSSSEPTTTEITEYETELTVSDDIGRSSVGLKMQKLG